MEDQFVKEHPELVKALKELGHETFVVSRQGDAHSIWINPATGEAESGIDPRVSGKASVP